MLPEWVQKIKDRADKRLEHIDIGGGNVYATKIVRNNCHFRLIPDIDFLFAEAYKDVPRLIEIASEMAKHLMFVLRLMKMHSGCSDLDCLECKYRVDDEDGPCFGFEIAQTMQKWNGLL